MKISCSLPWNGRTLQIEGATLKEVNQLLQELGVEQISKAEVKPEEASESELDGYPSLPGTLTVRGAVLTLLASEWGEQEARTEAELAAALGANALYPPHGTLSSQLTFMKRRQEIHRPGKKNGSWAYVITTIGRESLESLKNQGKNRGQKEIAVTA